MSLRTLGKQSLIYGFGYIMVRLVTFLLLPLYTNIFNPEEYGVVALFYTFLSFMNIIIRYGMGSALLKFYVPADTDERKTIMTNIIASLFISGVPFLILCHIFRHVLSPIILGVNNPELITLMGIIIVLDTIWSIPMLALRSENRAFQFIALSLLNVGITMGFNLIFILKMGMGIEAVFLSNLIASGILFLMCLPIIGKRFNFSSLSIDRWKTILRFAIPFLPAGLFSMVMEVADRYILKYLTDLSTVGIYNAGYKVGMLMMLAVMGFNMGWQPYFLQEGKSDSKGNVFGNIITYVCASFGLIWVMILIWAEKLMRLKIFGYSFFGEEFYDSLPLVPWIALGYLFYGYYILQTPGIFLKDRPGIAAWPRLFGALTNIGLNLFLIPTYGAWGAAISTCLSFLFMAILMNVISNKLYPIKIEWPKISIIIILLLVCYALTKSFGDGIFAGILISIIYPLSLLGTGVVNLKEVVDKSK